MGSWIALAFVVLAPVLMLLEKARALLIDGPMRQRAWFFVGTMAIVGIVGLTGMLPLEVRMGTAVLATVPAIQCLVFVALHQAFSFIAGRSPVPLRESQLSVSGLRYVADAAFWVIVPFGLIIGAALVCAYLDVALPILRGGR